MINILFNLQSHPGVERAEKSSEETTSTVKISLLPSTVISILNITISNIIQQSKVVKLERVVEELKEEIWELDTNNRFLQLIAIIIIIIIFTP